MVAAGYPPLAPTHTAVVAAGAGDRRRNSGMAELVGVVPVVGLR